MVIPLRMLLTNWLQRKREEAAVIYFLQIWYWGNLWSFYNAHGLNSFGPTASISWCAGVLTRVCNSRKSRSRVLVRWRQCCSRISYTVNYRYCFHYLSLANTVGNMAQSEWQYDCAQKIANKWPYLRCWPDPTRGLTRPMSNSALTSRILFWALLRCFSD